MTDAVAQMATPSSRSRCSSKQSSNISTSATASPMSAHRLWADISDGEQESSSEWGSELLLPETLFASSERVPADVEDATSGPESASSLNAYATEFLPTLSMSCPLVGICDVIVEGDETKDAPSDLYFIPSHVVAPLHHAVAPAHLPSERKTKARVPQGVRSEELSEEQVQRRIKTVEAGKQTKEYQFHAEQVRLQRPGAEPVTPDPQDATISKRHWLRVVEDWRKELRRCYILETADRSSGNAPEAASIASTEAEEAQGSEADDTITVNSEDASSAHWSTESAKMATPSSRSTCSSRQPRKKHRLWADISDGEDESSSEWGEELLLQETLVASSAPDASVRAFPEAAGSASAGHDAGSSLNAYATEFLPTLSMSCPLVGICEVIVEGDEAKGTGEDAASELCFIPSHIVAPVHHAAASLHLPSVRKTPPRVPQGVRSEELSEEQIQRRIRTVEAGKQTKEYQFHAEQVRLERTTAEPVTPDPRDATISKRQWLRVVEDWRKELRRCYISETADRSLGNAPEAASVASTEAEEAQGSEADDTITVNSDDASSTSTHWSSR